MTDPTVTAVTPALLRNCAACLEHGMTPSKVAEELRAYADILARSALADVGENDYTKRGGLSSEGEAGALLATEETGNDRPAAPNYGDDDGPGEEDGPWSDGWEERKTGKQPRPAAEDGSDYKATVAMLEGVQSQPQAFSPESLREISRRAIALLSPAAHTAQVTAEEREALDWAATQADEYANECDLLHYGHECAHARRWRLLRRLASTAEREK